ncbi:MAG TPA: hypothetical protein VKZ53_22715 [Candidatus Angelobacter sp.]|nr:hypothetical protein [Candidatus Angelobacter sp.]
MIPFAVYAATVRGHIEQVYQVAVVTREFTHGFLGDLNGAEIHIDRRLTDEQNLFLLAHLFGHTVQWNTSGYDPEIAGDLTPPVAERLFPAILHFEREAAAYGLGLLHEVGIFDIDRWFSDYAASDQAYLLHYYRTGERGAASRAQLSSAGLSSARLSNSNQANAHLSNADPSDAHLANGASDPSEESVQLSPLIQAKSIPPFTPQQRVFRFSGVVI